MMILEYIGMAIYGPSHSYQYYCSKMLLLLTSFFGILSFTLLGRIDECKCVCFCKLWFVAVTMTMEMCLQQTAEDVCFNYQHDECSCTLLISYIGTQLRFYPHCHHMHFWRGFIEYIAVLCSVQYLLYMFADRNVIAEWLLTYYGVIPSNPYLLKEMELTVSW